MANANKALKDLIEEGKESGVLSLEDLNRSMAEADLSAEDSDDIRDALSEEGVQILDQKKFKEASMADKETYTEDRYSSPDISNSIRMYLTEMGKVPLLSR